MTDTLGLQIDAVPPKEFIRGQTLEFLMDLPPMIPNGHFVGAGITTTMTCQLRKAENASDDGLIADLVVTFEDQNGVKLRFKTEDGVVTDEWPLGLVEFDVLFVRSKTTNGVVEVKKTRSLPVRFLIKDGISK